MKDLSRLYRECKAPVVAIAGGVYLGKFLITHSLSVSLMLLCGILATYVIFRKAELGILAIVILVCSLVFEEDLPLIKVGFGSLQIADVILFILLCKTLATTLKERQKLIRSPLELPMLLFLAVVVCAALNSILLQGLDINDVFRLLRITTYYLLFYVITHLIKTREQIRFLATALFWIAGIVAAAMLIQAAVGDALEIVPGGLKAAGGLDEEYQSLRLQPPGQTLIYIAFVTSIYFFVFHKGEAFISRYFFLLMLLGSGVMLTYNRSYLVTIFLSTVIFMLFASSRDRKRLMTLVVRCAGVMLIVVLLFGAGSGKLENIWYAVSHRYLTLFAGNDLIQSSSLNDRRLENNWAIEQIVMHPVEGIGLGKEYRPQLYGANDEIANYVHNVYLWLLMDLGVFGFAFFIWFYLGFLVRAIKNHRKPQDDLLRSVAAGSTFAGLGMLPMALVIPLFMEWHSIVVIVIFMGLSEAIVLNPGLEVETTPTGDGAVELNRELSV